MAKKNGSKKLTFWLLGALFAALLAISGYLWADTLGRLKDTEKQINNWREDRGMILSEIQHLKKGQDDIKDLLLKHMDRR